MGQERYGVFGYLGAPEHADTYRAIMLEFARARERFIVHLRTEELSDRAEFDGDLVLLLSNLVRWGNLKADPDTSRVSTVEEFNRARFVYQMTPEGEAAERALAEFDRSFDASGALQSWALEDIVDQLNALLVQLRARELDEAKTALALNTLADRFSGLAANAQAFSGDLQRTIDLRGVDTEAFIAYKERLIGYLQRFIQDLVARTAEIARLLAQMSDADVDRLLRAAAARESRDASPDVEASADPFGPVLERWHERFAGFRQWFVGGPNGASQSQQLRHMAINAVPALLGAVQRLGERRAGRSDRVADFRTLAFWFAEAPDDKARHRLASVAFGLAPARHLAVDEHTLEERRSRPVPPTTSWADAPAVEISPRLRATGSYERRGQPTRVRNRAAERRAIALQVEAQRIEAERLLSQLATAEPVPMGNLPIVEPAARTLLLHLLGDALAQRRSAAEDVSVVSLDGAYNVDVRPSAQGASSIALTDGILSGPAHLVRVRSTR